MHDTLKKPREILMASYAVRYPEIAAKTKSIGGELDMDPQVSIVNMCYEDISHENQIVEQDRQHLLAIERLILETICFNFTSKMSFPYVIKAGKAFGGMCHLVPRRPEFDLANSYEDANEACMASCYR